MNKAVLTMLAAIFLCAAGGSQSLAQDDNKDKAQEHYNAGLRAYNVGEFDQAIKEWKAAYQFLGAPDFLFNIAQAYRQKRNYDEAIFFYNAYLRGKPDAANVAEVTALRDEMSALLQTQKKNDEMAPEPKELLGPNGERKQVQPADGSENGQGSESAEVPPPPAPTPLAGPVDDDLSNESGSGMRTIGIIAGGTGVAFVATGIAFALSASSTESDLEEAAANQEVWGDRFIAMEESAQSSATAGTVLIVAGIAAMVGGGVTYYLGHRKGKEASGEASGVRVVPTLALKGEGSRAGLAMGWSF